MSDTDSEASGSVSALGSPPPTPPNRAHQSDPRRDGHPSRFASRSIPSARSGPSNPTYLPPLPQEATVVSHGDTPAKPHMSQEARRKSMIAMDRKRRLTTSAFTHDTPRRRHQPSDFFTRSESQDGDEVDEIPSSIRRPPVPRTDEVDLTDSPSPPAPPPHSPPRLPQPRRTSSSSSKRYAVPPWQPDAEVSHCPICTRQFTWMFRRHHCRKCGRVVCDSCSPHRITIPRQFIVNPPRPEAASLARETHVETIDLTGDDGNENHGTQERSRSFSVPRLEGGEKVRLCNPCVPDPQPEPPSNYLPFLEDGGMSPYGARPPASLYHHPTNIHTNILGQPRRPNVRATPQSNKSPGDLPLQNLFAPAFSPMGAGRSDYLGPPGSRPRPSSIPNPHSAHLAERSHQFGGALVGTNNMFPPGRPNANSVLQLPGIGQYQSSSQGHGRYASLDVQHRSQAAIPGRPRGSSMFDFDHGPGVPPSSSHPRLSGLMGSRPRLHERDICPVCRRALPVRGEDGNESAREAHIMACIEARDPLSSTAGDSGSSSRSRIYTLPFVASEKDCVGDDGSAQECSICMEDFEIGVELARLECWCKFHKACIASWLQRKAECPVHKASRFNL